MGYALQIIVTLLVSLGEFLIGMVVGYPTKAVPQLLQDSTINFEKHHETWFASMFHIMGVILITPGGMLSGRFGRRKIILFSLPCLMIGWLLIGFAQNVTMLFFGRAISCACVCLSAASIGPYISESVDPKIRGSMVVLCPLFLASGILLDWVIGYFYSWDITAFAALLPCLILLISMLFLPETPYWLVENNRIEEAQKSIQFFRGSDASEELNEIHQMHLSKPNFDSFGSVVKQIFSRAFFKPYTCIGFIYILVNLTGFEVVIIYMVSIFQESGSRFDPDLALIIVGALRVPAAAFAPVCIRLVSPKILFVLSQLITALSMGFLSLCVYLVNRQDDLDEFFGWIPIISILTMIVMKGIALLPVMTILLNELYPTEIRSQAVALTETIAMAMGAASLTIYPHVKSWIGLDGACLFYCIMGLLSTAWGALTITDNRGVSLVKIEESMKKKSMS